MARSWKAQTDAYRTAIKALDGITGVMVRHGAGELAADLIRIEGYVAIVRPASGPNAGRTAEYPVSAVRPAAAFEVIDQETNR